MNKKVAREENSDKKTKKLRKEENFSQLILLFILIVLFGFTFFCTISYVGEYYRNKYKPTGETIEINSKKNNVIINNSGDIIKTIKEEDINDSENIVIERINTIELNTNNTSKEKGTVTFDIKYEITKNNFLNNVYATNYSDLLVRFSYSYDNENWNYLSNAISITDSNLSPLVGSYYDISGINTTLKVATNYELSSEPGEKIKIYWRAETLIQNLNNNIGKELNANFRIEYKNNV